MSSSLFKINAGLFLLSFILLQDCFSQNEFLKQKVEAARDFRLMFYNCENYFDIEDDTLKSDEEYLPDGERYWNENKYYKKSMAISKVIAGVGGWLPVDLIGLCEIENRKVLDKLVHHTPIYKYEYQVLHKESPDKRGIDVALLYREESFKLLDQQFIAVVFPEANSRPTRDILYAKGLVGIDTLHVFVNHWSSRWGGQLESEGRREFTASILRKKVDSLFQSNIYSKIVIMGDLNDEPHNRSVDKVLKAKALEGVTQKGELYNMMYSFEGQNYGTHKYQGKWSVLDHIIVSDNLLNDNGLYAKPESSTIYNANYLLIEDATHLGEKPFRTYVGFSYKGGFSDHLPVFVDFYFKE